MYNVFTYFLLFLNTQLLFFTKTYLQYMYYKFMMTLVHVESVKA